MLNYSDTLIILVFVALLGGSLVIYAGYYIINTIPLSTTESVPILAGIVGFLASIVTTIYQEISSRSKEKRDRDARRWELIFPMIKEGYNPWINSARRLRNMLDSKKANYSDLETNQILWYCCLFYGRRLQLILDHGDTIMLGTTKDVVDVRDSYKNLKESFQWATSTQTQASELQKYFVTKDSKNTPLVFETFVQDLAVNDSLAKSKRELTCWLKDSSNICVAHSAFGNFIDTFQNAINVFSGLDLIDSSSH